MTTNIRNILNSLRSEELRSLRHTSEEELRDSRLDRRMEAVSEEIDKKGYVKTPEVVIEGGSKTPRASMQFYRKFERLFKILRARRKIYFGKDNLAALRPEIVEKMDDMIDVVLGLVDAIKNTGVEINLRDMVRCTNPQYRPVFMPTVAIDAIRNKMKFLELTKGTFDPDVVAKRLGIKDPGYLEDLKNPEYVTTAKFYASYLILNLLFIHAIIFLYVRSGIETGLVEEVKTRQLKALRGDEEDISLGTGGVTFDKTRLNRDQLAIPPSYLKVCRRMVPAFVKPAYTLLNIELDKQTEALVLTNVKKLINLLQQSFALQNQAFEKKNKK